jgi:acetyl esterase/lipase
VRSTNCALIVTVFVVLGILWPAGNVALCAESALEENVTYGKADDTELKLDVARPQGDGPFPAIVFIHGGGWCQSNKRGHWMKR